MIFSCVVGQVDRRWKYVKLWASSTSQFLCSLMKWLLVVGTMWQNMMWKYSYVLAVSAYCFTRDTEQQYFPTDGAIYICVFAVYIWNFPWWPGILYSSESALSGQKLPMWVILPIETDVNCINEYSRAVPGVRIVPMHSLLVVHGPCYGDQAKWHLKGPIFHIYANCFQSGLQLPIFVLAQYNLYCVYAPTRLC